MSLDFNNIHKFNIENDYILMDINSGSVHVIDKAVSDYLDALYDCNGDYEGVYGQLSTITHSEIAEIEEEIKYLVDHHMLFTEDEYYKSGHKLTNTQVIKSICLNVAHACNLRCSYCFAAKSAYGDDSLLMSLETGKKGIDFLLDNSGNRRHCEVDFFGGEPLVNFDVVKQLIEYGRIREKEYGKEIKFTVTTNSVLLNGDIAKYLNDNNISMVLSIDGRKEVHNRFRIFPNGKGSHDVVEANINNFLKDRPQKNYYIRGTFTGINLDFTEDIHKYLENGYEEFSIEPVVSTDDSLSIKKEHMYIIAKEYEKIAKLAYERAKCGKPFNFFHFNLNLDHGPCLQKRLKGCGAGTEYVCITPDESIYPCHQFVDENDFRIGNLSDGITNPQVIEKFRENILYSKAECRQCWARFFCGGGCHANNYQINHDIKKPYDIGCKLMRIRSEYGVWLQVKLMELAQKS